ncbi:MAG: glycoside hydrolase [Candidatus Hydrogenedentota bacterium]
MNIVIPTVDYPPIEGGISSLTLHMSRELAAMGHDVTVVAPWFPEQEAFDENEPVTVLRYGGYSLGWFRFVPLAWQSWPHMRRADLVLGVNIAYGGVLGWLFRRPYVTFAYGYEFLKFGRNSLAGRILRRVYNASLSAIAISRFTRDALELFGVEAERIDVIHPGARPASPMTPSELDSIRHRYVLEGKRVVLAVGRLIERKGHRTLIEAMPRILDRVPDAHLVIVGQGPTMSACSRLAQQSGMREHVTFTGPLEDTEVAGLYAACDVFALPTGTGPNGQVEGFGLVFAEAHAYGKPVVAGRSGGVVDAVLDGETGLLVEPEDVAAVADAIVSILTDSELAKRLGENGKRRVETELNWATFTRALLERIEARR